jgi:TolB protein
VPSPDGRHVAFFSTRDEGNALYVMARDGSGQRKLADCNICVRVRWAPDSRRLWLDEQFLAYTGLGPPYNQIRTLALGLDGAPAVSLPSACAALSRDGARCAYLEPHEGGWKIVVRSPPGGEPVTVAVSAPLPMSLSWSPDGATLLYSTEAFRDHAVNVVGLDGRPPRKLAAGASPRWSPTGDLIAFLEQGESFGVSTLKVVGPDGGGAATIADGAYELLGWSPDGTQLAYTNDALPRHLQLVDRGGGPPLRIEGLSAVVAAAWSPDSGRLAVLAYPAGLGTVYTLRRDGSELRGLGPGGAPIWTPDGASLLMANDNRSPLRLYVQAEGAAATPIAYGELPALAPGGRRLAFVRGGKLFTIGTDGQGERGLAEGLAVAARPAWSPDGRRIAVAASADGPEAIYVVEAEANTTRMLAGCGGAACGAPSWSPDGETIFFGQQEIISVAVSGGGPQNLQQASAFALSPDGASIAYVAGDIFIMGADGTGARKLAACASSSDPSVWPTRCFNPAWSSDGRRLSYARVEVFGGKAAISATLVVDVESGAQLRTFPFHSARWWGQELAYRYTVSFGYYTLAHYDFASSYTKLAVPSSFANCCGSIPPGHGNALDYALVP